jgi:hypothetical protein
MALVVAMAHAAFQHIGHGFEAAMGMVGKARDIGCGVIRAEGIQHQKRVEVRQHGLADHAAELDAGAVARGHAGSAPYNFAIERHRNLLFPLHVVVPMGFD